jgi:hypothetical protein
VGPPIPARPNEHDGGDVAGYVGEHGDDDGEDQRVVQIPVMREAQQLLGQPGSLRTADDDEQPDEKDQQAPIDFVVDEARLAAARDQHDGRADGGNDGRWGPARNPAITSRMTTAGVTSRERSTSEIGRGPCTTGSRAPARADREENG